MTVRQLRSVHVAYHYWLWNVTECPVMVGLVRRRFTGTRAAWCRVVPRQASVAGGMSVADIHRRATVTLLVTDRHPQGGGEGSGFVWRIFTGRRVAVREPVTWWGFDVGERGAAERRHGHLRERGGVHGVGE